jgi:hypothetical protein
LNACFRGVMVVRRFLAFLCELLSTGSEHTIFPHVKGLVGQTLCKSYRTHLILLYRLMLTVVTMVAMNQFPKDCVYLRTTTKLHLSKDTLQYS